MGRGLHVMKERGCFELGLHGGDKGIVRAWRDQDTRIRSYNLKIFTYDYQWYPVW